MTEEKAKPVATGLSRVTLVAACVGWAVVPLAGPLGLLLVAWAFFVALTVVITSRRDGRRVARAAYATIVLSVLPAGLLHGSP